MLIGVDLGNYNTKTSENILIKSKCTKKRRLIRNRHNVIFRK
jgi:hypothetical protein